MLFAYRSREGGLEQLGVNVELDDAVWVDLYRPQPEQTARVAKLGIPVPTRAEMDEIELSARLYREGLRDVMTVTLPGLTPDQKHIAAPVTMILTPDRLVTVRHHAPRPFTTYPEEAGRSPLGTRTVGRVFLGLTGEIVARFADILEEVGRELDEQSVRVFSNPGALSTTQLREILKHIGRQGELLGRVRGGILTMERALTFFSQRLHKREDDPRLETAVSAQQRDIEALGVQIDFLSARIGLVADATLGMISLDQNANIRLFSVVAVFFLPPTLVASVYGMNFHAMPELDKPWGYPAALGLMVASAALTFLFFKWKKWL